jgi:thiosulfate reductase cytochrome b subunit
MTAGQQRKVQRVVHLAAAVVLLAYVYAPVEAQLQDAVRFMVFPLLTLPGIAMWQAPRIRRTLKAVRGGGDVGRVGCTNSIFTPRLRIRGAVRRGGRAA